MKKTLLSCLILLCVIGLCGCGATDLEARFPEYYNVETMKGLEVYLWREDGGEYRCGVLPGTNINKSFEQIGRLTQNAATVSQMKEILSSYNIDKDAIAILPIMMDEATYRITFSEIESAKELFWGK